MYHAAFAVAGPPAAAALSLDRSRGWRTAIMWFRRDLRLHDQPALAHAVANARTVVPLFVLDPRLTQGAPHSPARTWFLARSLETLDAELRARGSGLVLRSGDPETIVPEVAREHSADVVVVSRDVTPLAHRRDAAVARALGLEGRRLVARPGSLLVEPEEMVTGSDTPYRLFTPFWRSLRAAPRRALEGAPSRIPTPLGIGAGAGIVLPVANNAGGWQWTAGVGADPQPWFRIFNPVLQGRRFDPDGEWVRRWLPELARIPGSAVHAPWELSEAEQDAAGVRAGHDYPRPIVDLAAARDRALEAFRGARSDPASPGPPTSGLRPARGPSRG